MQRLIDKVDSVSKQYGLEITQHSANKGNGHNERQVEHQIYVWKWRTGSSGILQIPHLRFTLNAWLRVRHKFLYYYYYYYYYYYLGAVISATGNGNQEIMRRLGIAGSVVKSVTYLRKDRSLGIQLKRQIMRSLIWPVVVYSCETWTLTAAKENNGFWNDGIQKNDASQLERASQ